MPPLNLLRLPSQDQNQEGSKANPPLEELIQVETEGIMHSPGEAMQAAKEAQLRDLDDQISFSDRLGGEDPHFDGEEAPSFLNKNELSGIVENKDDKLTQS